MMTKSSVRGDFSAELGICLDCLRKGGVILYPTDSVWGIGCDATDEEAVRKVFALKRRQDSKSLVLLAASASMIEDYVEQMPPMAQTLMEVNDAPMTIIYPGARVAVPVGKSGHLSDGLAPSCVASDGSVGIRVPLTGDFCKAMLEAFGKPVVSTSANISGEATPRSFAEISQEILSGADYVVPESCGGKSSGRASQIIKLGLNGEVTVIRA